ncbi:MAG: tRNA glutamyl-Q(34) synthetase GluQRS [Paracoccaceae bacterium]|nr:tRNA glutamyl-Q(34) synthetase GluQRS [Paracoccaceae bacterium]
MSYATRFAPSPTGPLHLGHAYSAMLAFDRAKAMGGTFHLRIEDTDFDRCREEWVALIDEDLRWLGLDWPKPPLRQSDHLERYARSLYRLIAIGLVYPCSCTRADIAAAATAPQEGATYGPIYPGTCRGRPMSSRRQGDALRLDIAQAVARIGPVAFTESGGVRKAARHTYLPETLVETAGDIVLARKGSGIVSYFFASALDDAHQSITEVVRGEDLFDFTAVQVLLLVLLGLPVPAYHHHRLIRDAAGKRLAKRDDARAISKFRAEGATPADIRRMVGLPAGTAPRSGAPRV